MSPIQLDFLLFIAYLILEYSVWIKEGTIYVW